MALANSGRMEEALPLFKAIFAKDENWREMATRLPASGLLTVSEEDLKKITNLK